jgi:hypothetical protein
MIRFTCKRCQKFVQVAPSFAGKQGRCPFCKDLVRIPLESDPLAKNVNGQVGVIENPSTDDLGALKAALLNEEPPQASKTVPPPPQTIQQNEEIQIDLDDPHSDKTSEMPAIQPPRPTVVMPEKMHTPAHVIRRRSSRFAMNWLVLAIGVVVVVMAIILAIVLMTSQH